MKLTAVLLLCLLPALPSLAQDAPPAPANPAPANPAAAPQPSDPLVVDLSTPEKTVETFVATLSRHDFAATMRCVQSSRETPYLREVLTRPGGVPPNLQVTTSVREKTDTTATVAYVLVESREKKYEATLPLAKTGDEWKVVADAWDEKITSGATKMTNPLAIAATVVTHPDEFEKATKDGSTPPQTNNANFAALSNIKQIALGCLMYAQDYDEKYPASAANYKKAVFPYIKNDKVFTSPLDAPGTVSVKFNTQLAGVSMARIAKFANIVMLYEGTWGKPLFRYDGKAAVAFADGRVKLITPDEAKKVFWTLPGAKTAPKKAAGPKRRP